MNKSILRLFVIAVLAVATISLSSCKKKEETPKPAPKPDSTVTPKPNPNDQESAKEAALKVLKANHWVVEGIKDAQGADVDPLTADHLTAVVFADKATVYKSENLETPMEGKSEEVSFALSDDAKTLTVGTVDYTIADISAKGFTLKDKDGNVYTFKAHHS